MEEVTRHGPQTRTENLQRVPIAVSAPSPPATSPRRAWCRLQDITSAGAQHDATWKPNTNKFTNITLRGISSGGGLGNDPAIGVYVDEVYIGRDSGLQRRPAGHRTGRGPEGPPGHPVRPQHHGRGHQHHHSSKPGAGTGRPPLLVDLGDYDYRRLWRPGQRDRFTHNVAGKISAVVDVERDGYLDNTFGGTVNSVDYTTYSRPAVLVTPAERPGVPADRQLPRGRGRRQQLRDPLPWANPWTTELRGKHSRQRLSRTWRTPCFSLHISYEYRTTMTLVPPFQLQCRS